VIARGNTVRAGSSWHAWQMETSREDGEVILTDTVTGERTVLWIMPTRARATRETTDWTPFKLALEMVFGRAPTVVAPRRVDTVIHPQMLGRLKLNGRS
jgi:hypothetical protein